MRRRAAAWPAGLALVVLGVSCGTPPADTANPPTETEAPTPTETSQPDDTPTPAGEFVTYDDPPGDCILNMEQVPAPCEPQSLDLLRVTIERGNSVVITISFQREGLTSGEGIPGLGGLSRPPRSRS